MSRRGWKTANMSESQAFRVEAAVAAGYARNRDEFVRFWTEVGLLVTTLVDMRPQLSSLMQEVSEEAGASQPGEEGAGAR